MTQKEFDALVVEENEEFARVVEAENAHKAALKEAIIQMRHDSSHIDHLIRQQSYALESCNERIAKATREKRIKLAKAQMELEHQECITIHDAHQIRKKMIEAVKKAVSGIPGVDAEKVNVNFEFLENGDCDWEVTLD